MMNFRERLLAHPVVYKSFKWLVLPDDVLGRLVAEHYTVADGGKVLDLGCGFGDFAPFFDTRSIYLGIDHNQAYIETARSRNANSTATFIMADVTDKVVLDHGPYDLIMMSGVLHHLPTETVRELTANVRPLLAPGGKFVAMEPVFDPDQRLSARLIIAADRGRFARDAEGYRSLFTSSFDDVSTEIVSGLLRIPYTHVIVTASAG
jgi:SAM-dependent methyltransferase